MDVLGISCYHHDSAAALLRDGELVAAAEEERFSRKKHDASFPRRAIDFCLRQAGTQQQELDYAVFHEKPLIKLERILTTTLSTYPRGWRVFRDAMASWFGEKLWIRDRIMRELDLPPERVLFVEHHMSHAASALLCSPFEEAAILTVDGVGEWATAAIGWGRSPWREGQPSTITLDAEMRYPHSLGLLYSAFTAFLGFEVNDGEYKVMAMAPYGQPKHMDELRRLVHVNPDGSLHLDMRYFSFAQSVDYSFSDRLVGLFGLPRERESPFFTATTHPRHDHPGWTVEAAECNQKYADIAASIQRLTEEALLAMAQEAHRRTGLKRLCLAGGVALNSLANGRLLTETPFENIYIQAAAGDAGCAVGAALYAHHVLLGQPRRFVMAHTY